MGTPKLVKRQNLDVNEFISDGEDEEILRDLNRRGSNVSLSRFRSCPQLLDDDGNISNQAFESVADDTSKANQIHRSRSPLILRRFQLDQVGTPGSATPTPPSTPRSRHSFFSQKESPSTPNQGLSPSSTPRLLRRNHVFPSTSSRGSSFDSNKSIDDQRHVPLNEENLQKHESLVHDKTKKKKLLTKVEGPKGENNSSESKSSPKVIVAQGQQNGDELHNKCEMWLQTLNITQTDKIKSRSQIQLHPV